MLFKESPVFTIFPGDTVQLEDQALLLGAIHFGEYCKLANESSVPLEFDEASEKLIDKTGRAKYSWIQQLLGSRFNSTTMARNLAIAYGRAISKTKWHQAIAGTYDTDIQTHWHNLLGLNRISGKDRLAGDERLEIPNSFLAVSEGISRFSRMSALYSIGTVFLFEQRISKEGQELEKRFMGQSEDDQRTLLEVIRDRLEIHYKDLTRQRRIKVLAQID